MSEPRLRFFVEIVETATDKVERRLGPHHKRTADKVEAGASRNLDHERYYTRQVKETP